MKLGTKETIIARLIDEHWRTKFQSPTSRELAARTGESTSQINRHIRALRKSSHLLEAEGRKSRALTPVWVAKLIQNKSGADNDPS